MIFKGPSQFISSLIDRFIDSLTINANSLIPVCSLTIWVGHLPPRTTSEQLKETFGEFGEVESIDVRAIGYYLCFELVPKKYWLCKTSSPPLKGRERTYLTRQESAPICCCLPIGSQTTYFTRVLITCFNCLDMICHLNRVQIVMQASNLILCCM